MSCRTVYRVREPRHLHDAQLPVHAELHYNWPERNCETLMVDQVGTLYLMPKVRPGTPATLYTIPSFTERYKRVSLTNGKS